LEIGYEMGAFLFSGLIGTPNFIGGRQEQWKKLGKEIILSSTRAR